MTFLLWQIWSSAQDQVAVIKRHLGLLLPGIVVFLDVDDLEAVDDIEMYVQASQSMLLFASKGYFFSRNCAWPSNPGASDTPHG